MPPTIPTTEPTTFTAGETVKWTRAFSDYPVSDGWTRKYYLRGASSVDVVEAAGVFTLTAAASGTLLPGVYTWVAYAEKGAGAALERYELDNGTIDVRANVAEAGAGALQSHAERALKLVEAQLEELLKTPVESYSVAQLSTQRRKLEDLRKERNRYISEINAAKQGGGRLAPYAFGFRRV